MKFSIHVLFALQVIPALSSTRGYNKLSTQKIDLASALTKPGRALQGEFKQIGSDIEGLSLHDNFGRAMTISDDGLNIAIGSNGQNEGQGATQTFEYTEKGWVQTGLITGDSVYDSAGNALASSDNGRILAIGASHHESLTGLVQVFMNLGGDWEQMGSTIHGEANYDLFGASVAISEGGKVVAIGAPGSNGETGTGTAKGEVRVFGWSNGDWIQRGATIYGEANYDYLGHSVALSGDGLVMAVGSPGNDDNGTDAGLVRVFDWTIDCWIQRGDNIHGERSMDNAGQSLSISHDGTVVSIGAPGNSAGHVGVYKWDGDSWNQPENNIEGEVLGDRFGEQMVMSIDGTVLAVGAPENTGGGFDSGHVRVFHYEDGEWEQIGPDINGEANGYGIGLSLTGDGCVLAIGTPYNMDDGNLPGRVRVFQVPLEGCSSETTATEECTLNAALDETDDFCVAGIANSSGEVCCDHRCGTCGGENCSIREEGEDNGLGSSACCSGMIKTFGRVCTDQLDQRCVIPKSVTVAATDVESDGCTVRTALDEADDFCLVGVLNSSGDVCCDRACDEECGGRDCSIREGGEANGLGSSACCSGMIKTIGRVCEDSSDQRCVIKTLE